VSGWRKQGNNNGKKTVCKKRSPLKKKRVAFRNEGKGARVIGLRGREVTERGKGKGGVGFDKTRDWGDETALDQKGIKSWGQKTALKA